MDINIWILIQNWKKQLKSGFKKNFFNFFLNITF